MHKARFCESVLLLALCSTFLMISMGEYTHSICKLKAAANTSDRRINWDFNHTLCWKKVHRKRCSLLRMEAKFHTTLYGSKGDTVNHDVIRNHDQQAAKIHAHNRNLILKCEISLLLSS